MPSIADQIMKRLSEQKTGWVCTPKDFVDLGSRTGVDQALSRLVKRGNLRRIAHGFYDIPRRSETLKKYAPPDPDSIVEAIARRDACRILPDGLNSANLLGLTDSVATKIIRETDGYSRTLVIGDFKIQFRHAPPKIMRWAGKPGASVLQALRWLGPDASRNSDVIPILKGRLPDYVKLDLLQNINYLPTWIRSIVRKVTKKPDN